MKYNLITLLFLVLLTGSCQNQAKPEMQQPEQQVELSIDNAVSAWQAEFNVPNVAIGIIENGQIVKANVYGKTEIGVDAPQNMLFNVASVTKVVFTATVLELIASGGLALDEPLHQFFVDPDVADDPRNKKLTPATLLSQQSGFSNNWRWDHPTEKLTFATEPGTVYNYSGEGMEYLRNSIQAKHKTSLAKLADSLLFKPASMSETRHNWDGKEDIDRFSLAYTTTGELHDIEDHSTIDNAADDLITTVGDLATFGVYTLEKIAAGKSPYKELTKIQASISPNLNQGLGWRMVNDLSNGEYAIQHGGNDIGVAALIVLLPNSNRGVIVLTNGDNGALVCNNVVRAVLPDVGNEIIHRSYKSGEVQNAVTVSEQELQQYPGSYAQPSGRKLDISVIQDGLRLKMDGIPNLNFYPTKTDTFFSPDFDFDLYFYHDESGTINEASLSFEGQNMIRCEKVGE